MRLANLAGRAARRVIRRSAGPQSEALRAAILNLWQEIKAARVSRHSARKFAALKGHDGLKVHIGAGDDIRPGWVNIDLALRIPENFRPEAHPDTVCINHDLRLGLSLEEGSCDLIYSSHFLEHLEYAHGVRLMRDCHRALRPGGIFRAALPNFRGLFDAYLRGDRKYVELVDISAVLPEVEPGTETLVDHVNYGIYQHGEHKCVYDEEKIVLILERIGFSKVSLPGYSPGLDPDSDLRRRYSFYVEAIK
ncbi:MAG TPA: methyltransferase domain-containing protein [Blastocatellia bacterium]|nr:methyltransferase domain-containing protein [Blastocatellia bacterium]